MTIRVYIADDHAVLRDGLVAMIDGISDMTVVGEAENGEAAIAGCEALRPDVSVVDLTMPGLSGADVIRGIRESSPATRVLVLTMHDDAHYLRAALGAGASGYLIKSTASRDLIDAIRRVHAGSSYVRMSLSDQVLTEVVRRDESPVSAPVSLSKRERQVLELLAYGFTNKEIAGRLSIATKSVDTYRARIRDKLGLRGRAQIVRYALEHGILHPDDSSSGEP